MFSGQQRMLELKPDAPLIDIRDDNGPIQARRLIDRLLDAERGNPPPVVERAMFLRNYWYVAAWDDEVTRAPLARTLLGEDLVLFRKLDGTVIALEDRCAHRRLLLSAGRVIDDSLQCGYHGLVYNCAGECVKIPGSRAPRRGSASRPIRSSSATASCWCGWAIPPPPTKVASSASPGFPILGWGVTKVRLHIQGNYLLLVDNLLDLSHVAYVHNTTIGNTAVGEEAEVKFVRRGETVRVTRDMD